MSIVQVPLQNPRVGVDLAMTYCVGNDGRLSKTYELLFIFSFIVLRARQTSISLNWHFQ